MSLESLLGFTKGLDEQILRQYSKITQRWEQAERSIYKLTFPIGFASLFLLTPGLVPDTSGLDTHYIMPMYISDLSLNMVGLGLRERIEREVSDLTIADNPLELAYKRVNQVVRLPTFLGALTVLGKTAFDTVGYLLNYEPWNTSEVLTNLSIGMGLFGFATSIYLKDADPNLLAKKSFWKSIYETISNKILDLTPGPIPAQGNLEGYVHSYL